MRGSISYAHLDLRADDHGDPLDELRRLYAVAGERYLHFAEIFAIRDNFQGIIDRTGLDRSIADSEFVAASAGIKSKSQAISPHIFP